MEYEIGGWHKLCDYDDFVKWAYKESPYRLIADLDDRRGHWRVVFCSTYDSGSYLVKGNLGKSGRIKALIHANSFMHENPWGCPPPNRYGS